MIQVQYASQRKEVWDWYWQTWRRRLWKVHAVLFVVLAVSFFVLTGRPTHVVVGAVLSMALAIMAVAFMALYPQLRFKPQVRTILLDRDGLKTTIGKKSGARSWQELKSIDEEDGYFIITGKNGNAFIIPPRAFVTPESRSAFLSFARSSLLAGTSGAR